MWPGDVDPMFSEGSWWRRCFYGGVAESPSTKRKLRSVRVEAIIAQELMG